MAERLSILVHLLRNLGPILDGKAVVIIDNGGANVNGMFGRAIPTRRLGVILDGFQRKLQGSARTA